MRLQLPIASYVDPASSSARLLNCYIEEGGPQGKGPVLQGSPGISASTTAGTGPIRAVHVMHGIRYALSGSKFYRLGSPAVELGTVIPGNVRPQIADNGVQISILIEPRAWVYNVSTNAFAEITDVDFTARGASSVQFFDNYMSFTDTDSGIWFISDLAAATSFDSLQFATAEGAPDNLLTHVVDHRQAVLLGVQSTEIWDNVGASGFPFARSHFIEQGCLAKWTAAKADQSVIWLANDGTVRRLEGVTAVRISTHALEKALRGYTVAKAYAYTVTWSGHIWYVLTFPEATWICDITTQQWHERQSYGKANWRVYCAAMDENLTYVGDGLTNRIGVLDDVFTEWGETQVASWTYQNVYADSNRGQHWRLELVAESGVGLVDGQGSDPQVMLDFSDDGGRMFRSLPTRPLGKIGAYKQRAVWHRLGQSRDRVYRASISDPIRRKIIDTQAEIAGGRL